MQVALKWPWPRRIPLAWRQLARQQVRLLVALAGISFAGLLMFMQMGFRDGLFDSIVTLHEAIAADVVLISPQSTALTSMRPFPQRRLYQALSLSDVQSVSPLYIGLVNWKNPENRQPRSILTLGISPDEAAFDLKGLPENLNAIRIPDVVLFDQTSRSEFGPVAQRFRSGQSVVTEVGERRIRVGGLFTMGATFGADGNIITSDLNFLRIFPQRRRDEIDVGLIRAEPGTNIAQLVQELQRSLPPDVRVMSKRQFVEFERNYWATSTAIGFIFTFGTVIGFIVGGVIVYQILYSDVSDHLAEYATLKAMGYSDRYLLWVVFQEALILAALGYIPGVILSTGLYAITRSATMIPIGMTFDRASIVFILTLVMCLGSGMIAVRRLEAADPADIF